PRHLATHRGGLGPCSRAGRIIMTAACALELRNVEKRFGMTPVIRGVSLAIADGERHAIIGPNGGGKSTLFNLISGRFAPTRGSIRLHGEEIAGARPFAINRRGLARVFRSPTSFRTCRCSRICAAASCG